MASNYKRTSKKTGKFSKRTTTINANGGVTRSYSSKSPSTGSRRTVSHNSKTGKVRTTWTQRLGGGWTQRTTKTTGGSRSRRSSRSARSKGFSGISLWSILLIAVLYYMFG